MRVEVNPAEAPTVYAKSFSSPTETSLRLSCVGMQFETRHHEPGKHDLSATCRTLTGHGRPGWMVSAGWTTCTTMASFGEGLTPV